MYFNSDVIKLTMLELFTLQKKLEINGVNTIMKFSRDFMAYNPCDSVAYACSGHVAFWLFIGV